MSRFPALLALPAVATLAAAQTPCDQLKLSLPDTTVVSIQFVPAGPFAAPPAGAAPATPPPAGSAVAAGRGGRGGGAGRGGPGAAAGGGRGAAQPLAVPAYCRVLMILAPSSDSHIEAAMFLPVDNWNGKLQVVGN